MHRAERETNCGNASLAMIKVEVDSASGGGDCMICLAIATVERDAS